ncbi:MAG: M20/M25/M40 family metallo-hydrolase [Planctomycetota bacterium]|nr:M20/M25/M40 family metallo-hydrolase [Planctomycetota bacterium]
MAQNDLTNMIDSTSGRLVAIFCCVAISVVAAAPGVRAETEGASELDGIVRLSVEIAEAGRTKDSVDSPAVEIGPWLPPVPAAADAITKEITIADLRRHIEYLASDALAGREAGTSGDETAAAYVAAEFDRSGLRGTGKDNTHFQRFKLKGTVGGSSNVIGLVRGTDPELRGQVVVVGAHLDHVGRGKSGGGRLGGRQVDDIYNGANDNASGVAALLEIAQAIAAFPSPPARTILFIAFGAEEKGLIGSFHYAASPLFPLADTVAMLNLDMVGGGRAGELYVLGGKTSPQLETALASARGFVSVEPRTPETTMFGASDHWAFYSRRIPILFFFGGADSEYHRTGDEASRIVYGKVETSAKLAAVIAWQLATLAERPVFVPVPSSTSLAHGRGRIGILIDEMLDDPDATGVRVLAVVEGSPAEKAGVHPDDVIVEFNGTLLPRQGAAAKLRELTGAANKNEPVSLRVIRGRELKTLEVVLAPAPVKKK